MLCAFEHIHMEFAHYKFYIIYLFLIYLLTYKVCKFSKFSSTLSGKNDILFEVNCLLNGIKQQIIDLAFTKFQVKMILPFNFYFHAFKLMEGFQFNMLCFTYRMLKFVRLAKTLSGRSLIWFLEKPLEKYIIK